MSRPIVPQPAESGPRVTSLGGEWVVRLAGDGLRDALDRFLS